MSKTDPRMGDQTVIFWSSGHFWCQTALGAQMAPKPPPRAPKASPSFDFYWFVADFEWFFDDFLYHVGYFLSGLLHYFFGYLEASFSNFWPQVQRCWGRTQGSIRWQKNAKTSKASLRKRFSQHGGGTAGGNWDICVEVRIGNDKLPINKIQKILDMNFISIKKHEMEILIFWHLST